MDTEQAKQVRPLLAVLETQINNVGTAGLVMNQDRVKEEYLAVYKGIAEILGDPNLRVYAPPISHWGTYGNGFLDQVHQAEFLNSATKLHRYVRAHFEANTVIGGAPSSITTAAPIFISHGCESSALALTKEFIESLGLIPVIVAKQPSQGMSVDSKVLSYLKACRAAVILATGDDEVVGAAHLQPRQNVIHEIGLAQQLLNNKVIYLLEENTQFPSNIAPKVYERFTKDNLTRAFIAIIRELRACGVL